jgi:hypothetical protein
LLKEGLYDFMLKHKQIYVYHSGDCSRAEKFTTPSD